MAETSTSYGPTKTTTREYLGVRRKKNKKKAKSQLQSKALNDVMKRGKGY